MRRRKSVIDIDWGRSDRLIKVISDTLPQWEEWWLHALREAIRRKLGYIERTPQVPEEDFEESVRTLVGWEKDFPGLDLGGTLKLIDREIARRGIAQPNSAGKP